MVRCGGSLGGAPGTPIRTALQASLGLGLAESPACWPAPREEPRPCLCVLASPTLPSLRLRVQGGGGG